MAKAHLDGAPSLFGLKLGHRGVEEVCRKEHPYLEDPVMRSKSLPRMTMGLIVAVLWLGTNAARSQTVRPEAGPFEPSKMEMQSPPPQGVAIRAGRLFDSKSGRMLT